MIKTLVFIALLSLSLSALGAEKKLSPCDQIEKYSSDYLEDEEKAFEKFREYMATSESHFSSEKKNIKTEIQCFLQGYLLMKKTDGMRELPDYLAGIEDEYKSDFSEALKKFTKDEQKNIKEEVSKSRKIMEQGEEEPGK